ncbi:hypothetical protein COCNU_scaffold001426G000030 [Cocos nucifera]|nr:hypothetical protein [Cocos nucifera]
MPIQAVSVLEFDAAALSPTIPDEAAPFTSPEQGEVTEKRKKKEKNVIAKKVKISKVLKEAQAEAERVWAEVDRLKVASEIQVVEVERLQEALQREEEASASLKVALALSEDKRKKAKEEIDIEKERAVEVFKSSSAMEDIKIAFTKETFLEEFEICMRRSQRTS